MHKVKHEARSWNANIAQGEADHGYFICIKVECQACTLFQELGHGLTVLKDYPLTFWKTLTHFIIHGIIHSFISGKMVSYADASVIRLVLAILII